MLLSRCVESLWLKALVSRVCRRPALMCSREVVKFRAVNLGSALHSRKTAALVPMRPYRATFPGTSGRKLLLCARVTFMPLRQCFALQGSLLSLKVRNLRLDKSFGISGMLLLYAC